MNLKGMFKRNENFTKAKDKHKNAYTFIVAPSAEGKTHNFTISAFWLRNAVLFVCAFVFASFMLLMSYIGLASNYRDCVQDLAKMKSINTDLQQQLYNMNELAKDVEEQLLYLNLLETKINTLIEDQEKVSTTKSPEINEINANLETVHGKIAGVTASAASTTAAYFVDSNPISSYDITDTLYRISTVLTSIDIDITAEENMVAEVKETIDSKNDYQECYPDFFPLIAGTSYVVSDYFGYRTSPRVQFHSAVDFSCAYGTSVLSSARGTVTWAGYYGERGYYIVVDHGYGLSTGYAHLSEILVSAGDNVEKGDLIGRVGSTGYSTGNHLHFEVMENGTRVNPLDYISL